MKKASFTIGLDLGGTKLAAALVDQRGEIVESLKVPVGIRAEEKPKAAQKRLVNLMAEISGDFRRRYPGEFKRLKGIGLASAGPLNVETGELLNPVNFRNWKTVPVRRLLQEELKRIGISAPVSFQNDAIAASLAEGWVGGAKGLTSYAVVTVGTGIGTGVIFQGQPCQTRGMGSEFGHLIFNGGNIGKEPRAFLSVEGVASGTGILRRAKQEGFDGFSVEELCQRIETGETKWMSLFDEMSQALAALCYSLSIGFHLEGIFFSGGLIKVRDLYFNQTKKRYKELISDFNPHFECPIQIAKTKQAAGVVGAAYLPYLALPSRKGVNRW